MKRRTYLQAALASGLALLAGCQGDGEPSPADPGEETTETTTVDDGGSSARGDGIGDIVVPSGYRTLGTSQQGGVELRLYQGSDSQAGARSSFRTAVAAAGWTPIADSTLDMTIGGEQYSGMVFERDEEILLIQIVAAAGMVTVTGIRGPADTIEGDGTPEATTESPPTGPPTADVQGEDIPSVPRPPSAVRTSYVVVTNEDSEGIHVEYLAEMAIEDAVTFYQEQLPGAGWSDLSVALALPEWGMVTATTVEERVGIYIEPSLDYEGYVTVGVTYSRSV